MSLSAKFFKKVPSLEAISNIFFLPEKERKNFFTSLEYFLKCLTVTAEVPVT